MKITDTAIPGDSGITDKEKGMDKYQRLKEEIGKL